MEWAQYNTGLNSKWAIMFNLSKLWGSLQFLIPGYDLASLLSLRFVVLPAKVITFLESSKLFVEESKAWPNDSSIFAWKGWKYHKTSTGTLIAGKASKQRHFRVVPLFLRGTQEVPKTYPVWNHKDNHSKTPIKQGSHSRANNWYTVR